MMNATIYVRLGTLLTGILSSVSLFILVTQSMYLIYQSSARSGKITEANRQQATGNRHLAFLLFPLLV